MSKTNSSAPDFELNDDGLFVASRNFLRQRGFCCGNGCQNCPYPLNQNLPIRCRINPYSKDTELESYDGLDLDTPGDEVVM